MFKVGDEVICIISGDLPFGSGELPAVGLTEGATYTVCQTAICPFDNVPIVFLAETANRNSEGTDYGYLPVRFRKVERKSDSLSIEAFLAIKPNQFEGPKRTNQPAKRKEQA